jgi:glycosyltransferase involved in cell wall biosynthesis
MRIWFPTLRAGSGSDVYVGRLVAALRSRGVDAQLQWLHPRFEFQPDLLRYIKPPAGTDLIHANTWNGFAFARKDIPLVVTAFHCVYRNGYPLWKTLGQSLYHDHWIGKFERRSFARASAIVAMTDSAAKDFSDRFDLPTLSLIHGWVDMGVFKPSESFSGQSEPCRILIIGNASKRKGVDLLPALRSKLDDRFSITVVGGLRASWKEACPGVTFKSGLSQAELVHEYQQATLVVSLSRYEGFGYTALEAMACAKPVVAFDVTGIRDLVEPDQTGFLVAPENVDDLAAACKKIASDSGLATRMGCAGRLRASECFDEDDAVKQYMALYSGLIGR